MHRRNFQDLDLIMTYFKIIFFIGQQCFCCMYANSKNNNFQSFLSGNNFNFMFQFLFSYVINQSLRTLEWKKFLLEMFFRVIVPKGVFKKSCNFPPPTRCAIPLGGGERNENQALPDSQLSQKLFYAKLKLTKFSTYFCQIRISAKFEFRIFIYRVSQN